ncbi:MAG: DEAD/DEAH box helicase [Burkholderia sp.]|nr:DEAD/DEAH box helicase [Burkholderia sp.]
MNTFSDLTLSSVLKGNLAKHGFVTPTPVQSQAIPPALEGKDLVATAQTGTGKTLAFVLPLLERLLKNKAAKGSQALILSPTRELAVQISETFNKLSPGTGIRAAVVVGGLSERPQLADIKRGVQVIIATPGRLSDFIERRLVRLDSINLLILDEADRMLDMGFLPDLQRILNLLPKDRQTLLFSATFSGEIKKLASTYLRNPQTIEVARSNSTNANVTQIVYDVAEGDKQAAVVQLLRDRALKQVIVFCNSKIGASRLARNLERDGVVASAIHGDKTQLERMQALDAFKRGEIEALVATDVAARGLDIAELPAVINFDLPFSAEDYVHRIGRTGRAGATGDALSLCSPNERKQLADIEKLIKRPLEMQTLALDKPSRQRHDDRGGERGGDRGSDRGSDRSGDRHSGERGGRRDRDEHRGASGHRSAGAERGGRPRRHEAPVDDFFLKPYEPSAPAKQADDAQPEQQPEKKGPKRQVAALLGGFGMPRKPSA